MSGKGLVKIRMPLTGLVLLLSLLLAACASAAGGQQGETPAAEGSPPAASPEANETGDANPVPVTGATVQVVDNPELGEILVDSQGMTLYNFDIDTPTESMCVESDCVGFWPPLIVEGEPQAGEGLTGELTTIARPDGSQQVVYQGHPLYTFLLDEQPGDTAGHGLDEFGGFWYALTPSGEEAGSGTSTGSPAENPSIPGY